LPLRCRVARNDLAPLLLIEVNRPRSTDRQVVSAMVGLCSTEERANDPKATFAEARLNEGCARSRFKEDDRLPIGTAMAVIAGASLVLWSLIALALKSLLF
jgi:hypothetical protein